MTFELLENARLLVERILVVVIIRITTTSKTRRMRTNERFFDEVEETPIISDSVSEASEIIESAVDFPVVLSLGVRCALS